jgi:uncharacterized coiled-coil protein SlyX
MGENDTDLYTRLGKLEANVTSQQRDIDALQATLTRIVWAVLGTAGTLFMLYGSHILKAIAAGVK